MNFDDIGSLLSGLSDDDMAALNSAAEQLMGESGQASSSSDDLLGGIDPQMIGKIMQLMPLLQGSENSERTRLISALKPLLSPARRRKADEAMQLMHLLEVLPLVQKIF